MAWCLFEEKPLPEPTADHQYFMWDLNSRPWPNFNGDIVAITSVVSRGRGWSTIPWLQHGSLVQPPLNLDHRRSQLINYPWYDLIYLKQKWKGLCSSLKRLYNETLETPVFDFRLWISPGLFVHHWMASCYLYQKEINKNTRVIFVKNCRVSGWVFTDVLLRWPKT